MKNKISEIGFGGSCHWCTEAIFQSLIGVKNVKQGWIASDGENQNLSEAIIVTFDSEEISLDVLIRIHLETHSSTANHSIRIKYRSAVYYFNENQKHAVQEIIKTVQKDFKKEIITQIIPFCEFELNKAEQLNYYYTNPQRPFCKIRINPKLKSLLANYNSFVNKQKLTNLS